MNTKPTYWQKYDKVFKFFSYKKIFSKILEITRKLGTPFSKKSNKGRKFKIQPYEYAAYIAFEIVTQNSPYRDMELSSELYVNKHIDHSTFGKNFIKIPYFYFQTLLRKCACLLESLFGKAFAYIPDSTGLVTSIYEKSIHAGKKTRRKVWYKAHSLVGYYPNKGITYIKAGECADKHISDAEGVKRMLKDYDLGWAYLPADKGYDFETVYEAAYEAGLTPIIKKQDKALGRKSRNRKQSYFIENLYKKIRGIVETVFGGLENKGLLHTRFKRDDNIKKFGVVIQIRHNLMTYMKEKVKNLAYFFIELFDKLKEIGVIP
jgi:hypothetical protein